METLIGVRSTRRWSGVRVPLDGRPERFGPVVFDAFAEDLTRLAELPARFASNLETSDDAEDGAWRYAIDPAHRRLRIDLREPGRWTRFYESTWRATGPDVKLPLDSPDWERRLHTGGRTLAPLVELISPRFTAEAEGVRTRIAAVRFDALGDLELTFDAARDDEPFPWQVTVPRLGLTPAPRFEAWLDAWAASHADVVGELSEWMADSSVPLHLLADRSLESADDFLAAID